MSIDPPAGADGLHFSIAEIEEQRRAFERFDRESQDLLLAMTLSETPKTHPDTSLDWLIAQQLDEQEAVVDCPPMHNEVQTDGSHPTFSPFLPNRSAQVASSIQEHPETFQNNTIISPEVVETQGRQEEMVAFDTGATDELPSGPAHVDAVQSDFLFAKQLQVLDTPSIAPDDDQIASDHILAKELQDIETQSQHPDCHSTEADFLLAQELQELDSQALPDHPQTLPSNPDHQQLDSDRLLAQHLQEEYNTAAVELSHDERRVGDALTSLEIARDLEVALGVNQEWNKQPDIDMDELLAKQLQNEENETRPFDQTQSSHASPPPPWWTVCPNCAPNAVRKYHLIDIFPASEKWTQVTAPFARAGYVVTKMQQIQNQTLWNRFHFEMQSMRDGRPAGRDLNETLLYHTTSASKEVICEEGLDQRLSRQGKFGRGIYFRQANFVWIIAELCSAYFTRPFSPLPLPLSPLPSFTPPLFPLSSLLQ